LDAQAKPYELVSDERLQSLIDSYKRQYIREREKNDRSVFDTVMALTELREMRRSFAAALRPSA
jgi:hypothetical protein